MSRSRSRLLWVSAEQDASSLMVVVSAPSSCVESFFELRVFPPRSYKNLGSSPVPKLWLRGCYCCCCGCCGSCRR